MAPESSPQPAAEGNTGIRRINLGDTFISGDEGNLVDLTEEHGLIEFDVTPSFLDALSRGNRVLIRLREPGQLPAMAMLAFAHHLQFTVSRAGDRIHLILFKDQPLPAGDEPFSHCL